MWSPVLGKSEVMTMPTPGGGNALVTLSYWKSIEHLHAFAQGPSHKLGWDFWSRTSKQWPHIGIMHETYAVPAGSWENIYQNHHPLGMGELRALQSVQSRLLITMQHKTNTLFMTKREARRSW